MLTETTFHLDSKTAIPVRIERIRGRRGGYAINLGASGLRIRVPAACGDKEAKEYLERHRRWILKRFRERRDAELALPKLRDGGSVPFKGGFRDIRGSGDDIEKAFFTDTEFIYPADGQRDGSSLARHLTEAYIREAGELLERLLQNWLPDFGHSLKEVRLKEIKSRWGSCSAKGSISISWRPIMAPVEVFEYLLIHELCHLLVMGHGQAFWNEVAKRCPDYVKLRGYLNKHHFALMNFPVKAGAPATFMRITG